MNSVDPAEMTNLVKEEQDTFNLIYNGTINSNLNLPIVIDALKVIKDSNPQVYKNIYFHMYGDGPDLENVMQRAKELNVENVIYHGRLAYKDMYKALCKASALVLPPLSDIYSNLYYSQKLVESIYLKIPILASRLKTYSFYYPEECLFYFEPGNIQQIADSIFDVYRNPEKRIEKANNAFAKYAKVSWPVMSERYKELVKKVTAKN